MKGFIVLMVSLLPFIHGFGQNCGALGQNPATAFPVCGIDTFRQATVPICGGNNVPAPGCSNNDYTDKNPFWYRFTCYTSGTLGFVITPNTLAEDYDWQLFDITGRSANEIYTNPSLFVACDWTAEFGQTGASSAGNTLVLCDGPGVPLFTAMPNIIAGHTYLLLISHFSDTQAGYSLVFAGGSASITNITDPHLASANAACDGTIITVQLNKKMKCNSLRSDGSDFSLSPPVANVISASGFNCNASFDMDSLTLTLSGPLPPGTYSIVAKNGSDGNTLSDNCNQFVPVGDQVSFTVYPLLPTPMDSLVPVACAPDKLELVFRKKIRCNSIAPDGSDFVVTGTYPVTVSSASGNCGPSGISNRITVQLSAPIQRQGSFTITLRTGSDGNTIFDECAQETPAGSSLTFSTVDTVNADFTYQIHYGCANDSVGYFHPGANSVNSWLWTFDSLRFSNLQNPFIFYGTFGPKHTELVVSNGVCSDTSSVDLLLDNVLKPDFTFPPVVCPRDLAMFTDNSIGHITAWSWDFGNGSNSTLQLPPLQSYTEPHVNINIPVRLTVTNNLGCMKTIVHSILLVNNCYIAVPSAFTPNGDGLNDYLYPLNAYKASSLSFSVYNRFGQRVFFSENWLHRWDGKVKGTGADPGTYVWILSYINENSVPIFQKGTTILVR